MVMQKLLVTAAVTATLVFVVSASAADLPAKAPIYKAPPLLASYTWTGLYLGINGGGAWGHEDWLDNVGAGGGVSENFHSNGGVFGGQVGFRWQWNQLVLGIEGTWDWAGLRDTLAPGGGTEEFKLASLYTATGQIGWAGWDRFLVYVKGGWAGGAAKADVNLHGDIASNSQTVRGWTAGGGVDYAIWQNIIVGVEYDHFDLNYDPFIAPGSAGGAPWIVTNTSRFNVDQVVARLSYKFDWPR
jgi:outer membrane immunogenic protein